MRRILFNLLFLASTNLLTAQNTTFNIIFKQDFEDDTPGLYDYNEWKADWNSPAYANGLDKTYIVKDATGNKVMQWNYPAGSVGPSQGGGQFEAPFNQEVDEVYFSYNIKFKPGFEWVLGGKIPGLTGGPHSYSPGIPPSWDDGFSNGLMWGHGYAGQDDIGGIYFYTYHQDQSGGYGDSFRWGNFKFQTDPERWYNITIRMVMNTVKSDGSGGNYDGIMEGFVDGKLVVSKTGMRFRNLSSIHIDKMKIYSHYGGSGSEYAPSSDEWSEIDNVCLFTYASGVDVPRGNTPSPAGRVLDLPDLADGSAVNSGSSSASTTAPGDMMACWLLDNNGTDESGHNFDLSFYNGTGFTSDTKQGTGSMMLDGTDDYAASPSINLGNAFTMGMWVKIPSGRSNIQTILANGPSGSATDGFKIMVNTYGTSDAKLAFESGDGSVSGVTRSDAGVFEFDKWNYVAATVDKSTGSVRLYYNGTDVTSQQGSHKSFKSSDAVRLGTMSNSMFPMKGEIDHVDILGRVLSSTEIIDLMNATEPVTVSAPSGLQAASVNAAVTLNWSDNSDNETGFVIERSTSETSGFSPVKTLSAGQVSWTDSQVSVNGSYYYRVKAVSNTVESDFSNTASVKVLPLAPSAPSNLAAGNESLNSLVITWKDNDSYEDGFLLQRSENPASGFVQIAKPGPNMVSYTDKQLSEGTTYYYRISAYNVSGYSPWSAVAAGTTAAPVTSASQTDMYAYWPLNNEGMDLSGNGRDLTLYNGITYTTDHKEGSAALSLDGNDDYAASPVMDPGNTFTITTWIKIPSGESNIQTIAANGKSGSNSNGFKWMVNTYGTSDAKIAFESGNGKSSAVTRSNAGTFTFGTWNHVAVTVDRNSGVVTLYLNGRDVTAVKGVHTSFKTSGALWLGSMTNSNFAMKGQLDDVRVYAKVLSASEIMESMSGISLLAPTSLSATNITYQSVGLSWNDNSTNETGFQLERSLEPASGYAVIASPGAGAVSFTDNTVDAGTTYYYRLRAVNASGNSAWTAALAVTTEDKPLPVNNMFACWPMDNSGIDITGHGYDLTLYNGPKYSTDSKQGSASIGFDGYDDFTATPVMDPGNEFTISLWAYIPSGRSNIQTLVANGPSGSTSDGFKLLVNTYGTTDQKIIFESGDGTNSATTRSNTGVFAFDRWNHVAVTVNRTTGSVRIYYNGADVTASAGVHTRFNTANVIRFGRMTNNIFNMKGNLDDIRIYNRVLADTDVKSVMNEVASGSYKAAYSGDNSYATSLSASDSERDVMTPDFDFVTYPNPFINTLNISNAGIIDHVELIDLSGKILRNITLHGESLCTLNTENLPSGIYLVKITTKRNYVKIQKVIRY